MNSEKHGCKNEKKNNNNDTRINVKTSINAPTNTSEAI